MTDLIVAIKCVFSSSKILQNSFSTGAPPRTDPAVGAYDAPPDLVVGWGGGHPLPIPFKASRFLGCQAPNTNSWLYKIPAYKNAYIGLDITEMQLLYAVATGQSPSPRDSLVGKMVGLEKLVLVTINFILIVNFWKIND